MDSERGNGGDYVLGHTRHELDRLISQGRFLGDLTEHVLRLAGLSPGMRVLDVGCGAGDVSFLARGLVGEEGSVLGVDRSPEAVAAARERARQAGIENVEFRAGELDGLSLDDPVDAIIGRLVVMYFPRPAETLRSLLGHLRPGGIVAFQELDTAQIACEPPCELYLEAGARLDETFRRAGADIRAGLRLATTFQQAGLPRPQTLQMARVEHGPESQAYGWIEGLTRTLLPMMEATGVATAESIGLDTLAARMRDEAVAKSAVLVLPPLIGAWARKPG